jgi:NADH:ubiquinone oxidoreductase subunit 3 (subunit A)
MNAKHKMFVAVGIAILSLGIIILLNLKSKSPFEKMTPAQQDKTIMALYESGFNAAQTNWTMIIVPRTN